MSIRIKLKKFLLQSDGYSLIEVFFLIALMMVISGIIYTNFSSISSFITKGKVELANEYELTTLKLLLDSEVGKINTPWFYSGHEVIVDDNSIELFYYNGQPEDSLKIEFDKEIKIYTGDKVLFNSTGLEGLFYLDGNFLVYESDQNMVFPLGVFLE